MQNTMIKILSALLVMLSIVINAMFSLFGAPDEPITTTSQEESTSVTTTAPPQTTKPVSTTVPSTAKPASGTFTFTMYGYGHGVGMSQRGAITMANSGKGYEEILTHYFAGTTVKKDSATPTTVKYGGAAIPLVEYLCRTARAEIGTGQPAEALKAQIVIIYTFAKYYDFDVSASKHAYNYSFSYSGTDIHKACLSVLGITSDTQKGTAPYVDYKGETAFTCYFSSSAGKTTSATNTWGGTYPYLKPVSSPETVDKRTLTLTSAELKEKILAYDSSIQLDDDPSKWIQIVSHDGAVSSTTGYVISVKVGNRTMKGNAFRANIMGYSVLRSHCFTVEYTA